MTNPLQAISDDAVMIQAARDLLIRTAELPETTRELLVVLGEYRRALHALVVDSGSSNPAK
jgi:hypothetical protein